MKCTELKRLPRVLNKFVFAAESNKEQQACELAKTWHNGQTRKFINTPYFEHPESVVKILKSWGIKNEGNFVVAYCHDLLEDMDISENEIELIFGADILKQIKQLSKNHSGPNLSKEEWLLKLSKEANIYTLIIKLSDRVSNVIDFIKSDKVDYAKTYWPQIFPIIKVIEKSRLDFEIKNQILKTVSVINNQLDIQEGINVL